MEWDGTHKQMEPDTENAATEEKTAQFDALMSFLDADTYEEKLEILYRML